MPKHYLHAFLLSLILLLNSCGGGGGGSSVDSVLPGPDDFPLQEK